MPVVTLDKVAALSRHLFRSARSSIRGQIFRPEGAIVFLTYRCTSRCSTCNMWQRPEEPARELSWEEWKLVLEQLHRSSIGAVELFGGDALLRRELLFRMIAFCRDRGIRTSFPTNASALTDETIEALVEAGLGTIYLSLDEVPEIEGQVRGVVRHFERVSRAIERIRAKRGALARPTIECITTVSVANYRYLPGLLQFTSRSGVDAHHVRGLTEFPAGAIRASAVRGIEPNPYFVSSGGVSNGFSEAEAEELQGILRQVREDDAKYAPMTIVTETLDDLGTEHIRESRYLDHVCQFATNHVVISPYGEVLPCLYYDKYVLGDLRLQRLSDVWGNVPHRDFCSAQRAGRLPICRYCSIKSVHRPFGVTFRRVAARTLERLSQRRARPTAERIERRVGPRP